MTSEQQAPVDDWELAADNERDQNLSQQASHMHISRQAPSFRPQANAFVPGGQPFCPQQQFYQQGYPPQQQVYGASSYLPYRQQQYGYQQQQDRYVGGYGAQYNIQQYQPRGSLRSDRDYVMRLTPERSGLVIG
jgi:hypothetical protein